MWPGQAKEAQRPTPRPDEQAYLKDRKFGMIIPKPRGPQIPA
jgi:hypothetical protein